MDKKLFHALTSALKNAAAFERGEKIGLRVVKLPLTQKRLMAKEITGRKMHASKEAR